MENFIQKRALNVITPSSSFMEQDFTKEELELISRNKQLITKELNQCINLIKTGFKFLGINVILSTENVNQLDFYDSENSHIFSKKFEDDAGLIKIDGKFIQVPRLQLEFIDRLGTEYTYVHCENKHAFYVTSADGKVYYNIDIFHSINQKPSSVAIYTEVANADYIIKKFDIDNFGCRVELNNQFGPYGNIDTGVEKVLRYNSRLLQRDFDLLLDVSEAYGNSELYSVCNSGYDIKINWEQRISGLTSKQFYELINMIARHPKNREFILFTIDELDKQLPGIKQYVSENFTLFNSLTDSDLYKPNSIVDSIFNAIDNKNSEGIKTRHKK